MSSPTANGQTKTQGRVDRRKEWWSKNKEFKSKLRDRSTLAKKENEQHPQISVPKVETSSRGFRSAVVSKLASAVPPNKSKKPVLNAKKLSPQSKQKTSKLSSKPQVKTDKVSHKKKPKIVSKPVVAVNSAKAKVEKAVKEAVNLEMSEISMNARGVEAAAVGAHIPQRYILFIGNLPYTIDKGQLMSHFRKTGGVKSIRIPKDKSGKGKGFAYVEFKDRISHGIALRLHHTTLGGRRINVEFSTSESKKKSQENSQDSQES
ncbi:uncharacterized protein [Littorina saxatilis]